MSIVNLLEMQEMITDLAHTNGGQSPQVVTDARTVQSYAWMVVGELDELARELGDKPWKPNQPVSSKEKVTKEIGDLLAMVLQFVNLARSRYGISPQEVDDAYHAVTELNIKRFTGQVEGYRLEPQPLHKDDHRYVGLKSEGE